MSDRIEIKIPETCSHGHRGKHRFTTYDIGRLRPSNHLCDGPILGMKAVVVKHVADGDYLRVFHDHEDGSEVEGTSLDCECSGWVARDVG